MRVADALLLPEVKTGTKYIELSGNSSPGFDWQKQWRFQERKASRGRTHWFFDERIAFDDAPIEDQPWKEGGFDPDEVNAECQLVTATESPVDLLMFQIWRPVEVLVRDPIGGKRDPIGGKGSKAKQK